MPLFAFHLQLGLMRCGCSGSLMLQTSNTHSYFYTHTHSLSPQVNHRKDYSLSGHLEVKYSNGDTQQLPLTARIQHPAVRLMHAQQLPPDVTHLPLSKPVPVERNFSAPLVFGLVRALFLSFVVAWMLT